MKWTCLSARYLGCWQSIWNVVTAWLRAVSKSGYHLWLSIGLARVPIENDLWPMSSVGFGPSQAGITFQDFSLCLSPSAWIMTQHWYSGASFSGPSGITGSNLVVRNQKRETQFIGRSLTEASFARAFPPKRISRSIMNSFLNIPSLCWTKFSSADQTTMTIIVSIERLKRFKVVPIVATRNCTMKICLPTHNFVSFDWRDSMKARIDLASLTLFWAHSLLEMEKLSLSTNVSHHNCFNYWQVHDIWVESVQAR
jgi:hypothetical protein